MLMVIRSWAQEMWAEKQFVCCQFFSAFREMKFSEFFTPYYIGVYIGILGLSFEAHGGRVTSEIPYLQLATLIPIGYLFFKDLIYVVAERVIVKDLVYPSILVAFKSIFSVTAAVFYAWYIDAFPDLSSVNFSWN